MHSVGAYFAYACSSMDAAATHGEALPCSFHGHGHASASGPCSTQAKTYNGEKTHSGSTRENCPAGSNAAGPTYTLRGCNIKQFSLFQDRALCGFVLMLGIIHRTTRVEKEV